MEEDMETRTEPDGSGPIKERSRRLRNWLLVLTAVAMIAGAALLGRLISRQRERTPDPTDGTIETVPDGQAGLSGVAGRFEIGESRARLQIRLSEGQDQPEPADQTVVLVGDPLDEATTRALLDRLPPLTGEATDVQAFRLPEASLPPPRTGDTIEQAFPVQDAPQPPDPVASGPLQVLRFAPEGEIPLAPFLNVTFNQPMVPLATLESLTAAEVPVRLSPAIPGVWKWIGTRTLSFEFRDDGNGRFPMATEYRVEIPAGTRSAVGGTLAETVSWTFATPPPQLVSRHPVNGPQPVQPLLFLSFDQQVDPAAVLATIRVSAAGQDFDLRLATAEEIADDAAVKRLAESSRPDRWLAFKTERALPGDTAVSVVVGPGTPSAEGPRRSETAEQFNFRTFAPLRVVRHECGWSPEPCPPFSPFSITFNNPLDSDLFDEELIAIDPALPGATISHFGNSISIQGNTRGQTNYRVTVKRGLQDVFGQRLAEDAQLTFRVGSAEPRLLGPGQDLITLDPGAVRPVLSVFAINYSRLQVKAYRANPSDWRAYQLFRQEYYRQGAPPTPPGELALEREIRVEAATDQLTEVDVDLSPALSGSAGHLIVIIEPPPDLLPARNDRYGHSVQLWVQVTRIGLDAFVDGDNLLAWTTDLASGAPLAGVEVSLVNGGPTATTGPDGTARLALADQGRTLLLARQGDDLAFLPAAPYIWDDSRWRRRETSDELRWYVFDDRQMYRPGETVHLKGWLRQLSNRPDGDIGLVSADLTAVRYSVSDPQGNELHQGQADLGRLGGFDFSFDLPTNSNLGYANVRLRVIGNAARLYGAEFYHGFQIQQFRRPEFEVQTRQETTGPYFVGEHAVVAANASYFAGGALPNAPVNWTVTANPGHYSPPNWPDFTFGTWTPWWYAGGETDVEYHDFGFGPVFEEQAVEIFTGFTDAGGNHYLRLDFETMSEPRPFSVRAEAQVTDVNRQAWAASVNLLVHPATLYVGLRSERTFVEAGQPLIVDTIVTDLDGVPVTGRAVRVEAARLEWKFRQGQWIEEAVDVQECAVSSDQAPQTCRFDTAMGGTYRIQAIVDDDKGRLNQSQFTRWVSGGQRPPARNVEQETVELIPDKEIYQPGDVAQVLVQAPFTPAEGLLIVARNGIRSTERFTLQGGSHTLRIPISEAHLPNLQIQVELVGQAPRSDDQGVAQPELPPRPAYASGELNLNVSTMSRGLTVALKPQADRLGPGEATVIDVTVTDAAGRPVPEAEVALIVVDEAILALTNYNLMDPLAVFYTPRSGDVSSHRGRANLVLARPDLVTERAAAAPPVAATQTANLAVEVEAVAESAAGFDAARDEAGGGATSPIQVRSNFDPLAAFAPAVRTDQAGRAAVPVQLPDNLTRYRIMAVAVAGEKQFGTGESNLVARLPLMVRPAAPRFLNFGDRVELPVVVQNQTDAPLTVDVVIQTANLALTDGAGRRVVVPANDRIEVRFPATTVSPGTARLQVAAVSGDFADAATIPLPVYTPATTEAFAVYGVVDQGAVIQPLATPVDVFSQFGGLEINTSSTALQALTDAVLYLTTYPFDSTEQLASRILAIAALRDVLTAFAAEGLPAPAALEERVRQDIERLTQLQNDDGGFPIWARNQETIPFYSIHATHALVMARQKGFSVPEDNMTRARNYLRDVERFYPRWYDKQTRDTLSAYAIYVREQMGDPDRAKAARLLEGAGLDNLSLEAVGWLWPSLAADPAYQTQSAAILRHLNNRAVETAGAANFTTAYGDQAYLLLASDRRVDAVILNALVAVQPANDLIPKVVNGLMAHRTRGRWSSTQDNVFVLLALDRYFNTFEAQTPDFVARIWLGETFAGEHTFTGRTTERRQTDIPMAYLVDAGPEAIQDLILSKEGPGRLYYRLGLRYAPTDLDLDPLDMGFIVQRSYEAVDDPADVMRDEAGVWRIKAGARVRVRITMVAENRRYHVALVDALPAGLEIINPALAVSGSVPADPADPAFERGWWWWGPWFEHQNLRDERAEAFTTLLWEGVYTYSYVARATTPGTYVVPPARAEEMYSPEVFGRSANDWVVVE